MSVTLTIKLTVEGVTTVARAKALFEEAMFDAADGALYRNSASWTYEDEVEVAPDALRGLPAARLDPFPLPTIST